MRCLLLLALVACHGTPPPAEPLHAPDHRQRPDDPPPEVHYVDDCAADFHRPAAGATADARAAAALTQQGDAALAAASSQADARAQADKVVEAIQHYRAALLKDPYDADATLQLALAYDRVVRKGCALALLKRLAALAESKKVGAPARAAIDRIGDNASWFKAYRREAQQALGQ